MMEKRREEKKRGEKGRQREEKRRKGETKRREEQRLIEEDEGKWKLFKYITNRNEKINKSTIKIK